MTTRKRAVCGILSAVAWLLVILNWSTTYVYVGSAGDFGSFLASGRAMLAHRNPFGTYPLTNRGLFDGHLTTAPNLNPPISIYPFTWVAHAAPLTALHVWYVASIVLYAGIVALLLIACHTTNHFLKMLWAAVFVGFWETVGEGQVYIVLLLFVTGGWLGLRSKRRVSAGVCIGILIAVKPVFGLWALFLLLGGMMTPSMVAIGTAGMLWLVPLLISGPRIYRQWLTATGMQQRLVSMPGNMSLPALAARAGAEPLGYFSAGVLVVGLAWYIWRARPGALSISTFAIIAAVFVGPLSWPGYLLFLLPALWRPWNPTMTAAGVLFAVPIGLTGHVANPVVASIYAVPLALALITFLRETGTKREDGAGDRSSANPSELAGYPATG